MSTSSLRDFLHAFGMSLHGIMHISANHNPMDPGRDAHMRVSTMDEGKPDPNAGRSFGPLQKNSLSMVINNYKAAVKWRCRDQHIPFAWQGNFHDNIIRSDKEYHRIRWYVENNAANWEGDSLNPEATTTIEFPEDLR